MLAAILVCGISFTSCDRADNPSGESTVTEFQYELDQALSWAQVYGPPTQTLAEDVTATATERGIFGRYKHQTSDRGYRPRLCRIFAQ